MPRCAGRAPRRRDRAAEALLGLLYMRVRAGGRSIGSHSSPLGQLGRQAARRADRASSSRRVPDLQASAGLLQALLEGASDRHRLADGLHLVVSRLSAPRGTSRSRSAGPSPPRSRWTARSRRGGLGDVVGISSRVYPTASLAAIFAMGKAGGLRGQRRRARHPWVHLDDEAASGLRGPPRTARSSRRCARRWPACIAMASSRISWYSRSDRVWAGATVMESPVCTPIASKFSIGADDHRVVRAVGASPRARTPSSPSTDSSTIRHSPTGDWRAPTPGECRRTPRPRATLGASTAAQRCRRGG